MSKERANEDNLDCFVGAERPHNIVVSGVDEDGMLVDVEFRLTSAAITIDGHCQILCHNDQFMQRVGEIKEKKDKVKFG